MFAHRILPRQRSRASWQRKSGPPGLAFFEGQGVKVRTVLGDSRREFFGREDRQPYELFLQLEEIEYRKANVWAGRGRTGTWNAFTAYSWTNT